MRRKQLCFALASALLYATGGAFSQQTTQAPAEPARYANSIYLKVPADKEAALIDFYKSGAGSKVIRARMKADSKFFGWSLREVMYPGEKGADANFIIVAGTVGAPSTPDPTKRDVLFREAADMTYAQYMRTVRGMSERVGSSLSHVHHITDGFAFSEGDVVVTSRVKTTAGKSQDLTRLIREVQFPLLAERVKSGGPLKGWAWSHLTFPSGSSLDWDVSVTSVYKTLADALSRRANSGGATAERFAKMFPTRSYVGYVDDLRDFAKPVRTDVHRVVVAIQP